MRPRYDPPMKFRSVDILLLLALIAGTSFYFTHWFPVGGWPEVAWKGAGVALLSAWAFARGRPWIAMALAFGALGDVLLDAAGLTVGAVAFLIGHCIAAMFYLGHLRKPGGHPHLVVGAAIAAAGPAAAGFPEGWIGIFVYSVFLGLMAETALRSRFWLAGVGALLFVLSDLLIFARMGPLAGSPLPGLLIWPTYFAGQALIAWGVVSETAREDLHDRL